MAVQVGSRLGSYEITAKLGAGGMGEVYLARDTRLDRDVAIKVLPEVFVADPDRLARFEREARLLAQLHHPHIASIFGLEEAVPSTAVDQTPVRALIMELVDGPTLADRLARGPIAIEEATDLARQVAEALEEAHEKGIVHRDLKPQNIKVGLDGKVKVLDFGLAKAMAKGAEVSSGDSSFDSALANSPTVTDPMTQMGLVLGTAAYMAPEQARGKPVDKRADIWAFGCVLYEMLAGRQLFAGETVSDTLAAVLRSDVDWSAVPVETPAHVRRLLVRCLERDPRQRLRDIGEARIALGRDVAEEPAQPESGSPGRLWRRALPWGVAAAIAAVAGIAVWSDRETDATLPAPIRITAELADDASIRLDEHAMGASVVLSPAGDRLVFVSDGTAAGSQGAPGPSMIYTRPLDTLAAAPLRGTDGAFTPFFSPDGQWIAFFANGKLKKVPVSGGGVTTLADAPDPRGGAWLDDGTIVFSPVIESPLLGVPATGGTPAPMTTLDPRTDERTHRWPDALPGGRGLLYTAHAKTGSYDDASLVVQGPDGGSGRVLLKGGYHGRYLSSGHVVYMHDGSLFAVPFDLDRLELAGPAVPVIPDVAGQTLNGTAQYSVSRSGLLTYAPTFSSSLLLTWLDSQGARRPMRDEPGIYTDLRLSPEGDRVALAIRDPDRSDIWVLDLRRNTLSRLTFHEDNDVRPVWTPDGRHITYVSWRGDVAAFNLFWQRADGTGEPERLATSANRQSTGSWHPNGHILAFDEVRPGSGRDLMVLRVEGTEQDGFRPGVPEPFVTTSYDERDPEFSPDGRWLAYTSTESGASQVYVRPFPGPGGKWQVSSGSGEAPRWSRSTGELLYRSGSQLMAVSYRTTGDVFEAEAPRRWADLPPEAVVFDRDPKGDRVAVIQPERDTTGRPPTRVFVFNFLEELRRRVPRVE